MMTLDKEWLDGLRAKHRSRKGTRPVLRCAFDTQPYPCDVIQLLDALAEPEAPVLVWKKDHGVFRAGKWTIYTYTYSPKVDLVIHEVASVARDLPTLAEAQDLAERLERELSK
jgi:hypothetical protein